MILRHLLTLLIVPPPNLVLFAAAGLLMRGCWRRAGRWLTGASVVGLLVLAIPAVSLALLLSLERGLPLAPPAGSPPGAIVILSAEVTHLEGPGRPEQPGRMTLQRLWAGVRLYRRTHLPILVSGGRLGGRAAVPVATQMANALREEFQVPARFVEDRSGTTWQNAQYSAAILRRAGIGSIWLVTNAWHEKRAILAFRHFGVTATAAPVALDGWAFVLAPSAGAWRDAYLAFHEWIGLAWYALQAWRAAPVAPIAASNKAP
ncbi:MAG: YdcF family protein [Rhodospirillales bacterium]|nr:YdcF family protein [Rhodospirillales bacterium]